MFQIFLQLKHLVRRQKVKTDNKVFHLLTRTTAGILLTLSVLTTSMTFFSNPIHCTDSILKEEKYERVINNYCWIHSTFTIHNFEKNDTRAPMQAYPGVSNQLPEDDLRYHKYYQWVCFVLFFQAIAFDFPRYLWKTWEGGRVKALTSQLSVCQKHLEEQTEKRRPVLEYLYKSMGYNNFTAFGFFLCELINFVNVIVQIYLTDQFVGNAFTTYGREVLSFVEQNPFGRTDPMAHAFPKVTKCTFRVFGPSGNVVPHDALCVLPLNLINEKIYLFLWMWFIIVAIASGLALIYRLATIFSGNFRLSLLRDQTRLDKNDRDLKDLCDTMDVGDWFFLQLIGKNVGEPLFTDFIRDLSRYNRDDTRAKLKEKLN